MANSLLALNSAEENPAMGYKYPLSDEAKAELEEQKKAEEGEDEREWYEPLDQFPAYGAGLLAAGASMMRQSGWRDTPITRDEMIGHAIPAGMEGYYNQKIMNQQEDAAIAEAEKEAAKEQEEEEEEIQQRSNFIKYMKDAGIPERKFDLFMLKYDQSPETALSAIEAWHEEQKKMTPEEEDAAFQAMLESAAKDDTMSLKELQFFKSMTPAMYPKRLEELRNFLKKKHGLLWGTQDYQAQLELEKIKVENRKDEFAQGHELALKNYSLQEFKTLDDAKLAAKDYALRETGQNIKFQLEERKVDLQGKKVDIDVSRLKQDNDQFMLKLEQQGKFKESDLERQDRHLAIQEQALAQKVKNEDARLVLDQDKHTKNFELEESKLVLDKDKFGWSKEKFNEEHGFAKKKFEQTHQISVQRTAAEILKWGQDNEIDQERIKIKLEELHQKNKHWMGDMDFNKMVHHATVQNKAKDLAFRVVQFENLKDEQKVKHSQWQDGHGLALKEHVAWVENQARIALNKEETLGVMKARLANDVEQGTITQANYLNEIKTQGERNKVTDAQWEKKLKLQLKNQEIGEEQFNLELARKVTKDALTGEQQNKRIADAREFFYAELEWEKAKIREQKTLHPKKLVGQDALTWAEENNPEVYKAIKDKKNHQVIKLDKYGNYDSVSEIPSGLLSKTQMDNIYKIQKDYTNIPAIKDANKIASLLVSLKNLAAQRKVGDPKKSSGVAEFAMIYKFMKSLDETSTVLASEFRNASHAGRSFFANVGVAFQKQWDGVQLGESQKTEILNSVIAVAHAKLTEVVTPKYKSQLLALNKLGGLPEDEARGFLVNPLYDYFEKFPEDKVKSTVKIADPEDDENANGIDTDTDEDD